MQNQSHLKKKPTKKESINMIVANFKDKIKEQYIKGLIGGQEIIATTILDYIEKDNKDLNYIKNYCETLLKSNKNKTMENLINEKGEN